MKRNVNAGGVMDTSPSIQEGFLCPMCMKDLGDFVQLQQHFSDVHTGKEDLFMPFKGLFDKAKQRLLKFDLNKETTSEIVPAEENYTIAEPIFVEAQELGIIISHTAYFKKIRDTKIDDAAVETNKLLIRLDKLINEAPSDLTKRKAFEKEVIPWVNDSEVQHCRFCGCKFSLAKRKHHCRLCGKIICGSCSKFLTFAFLGKLTNPAFATAYQAEIEQQKAQNLSQSKQTSPNLPLRQAERLLMNSLSILKRDGSEVSVSSLFNQEGEEHLRICTECKDLLNKRDQQVEQRTQAPVMVQMYDRLRLLMEEAERLLPSYCKMAESLCAGESLYDLQTAKDLRVKMIKLQEQIDFTSKRIGQAGVRNDDDNDEEDGGGGKSAVVPARQLTLQRNVQAFAAAFLRDVVLSMPNLPQENEYVELQNKHKAGLEHKINKERSAAAAAVLRASSFGDANVHHSSPSRTPTLGPPQQKLSWKSEEAGWTPSRAALTSTLSSLSFSTGDSDKPIDPLREQILLIKGFIRQAAVDGRLEEVKILERNLHELESELKRQQLTTVASAPAIDPASHQT